MVGIYNNHGMPSWVSDRIMAAALENLPLPAMQDLPVDVSTPTCDLIVRAIQEMNNNIAPSLQKQFKVVVNQW